MDYKCHFSDWVNEVLDGVSTLPRFSAFGNMGNMFVWGRHARAILVGARQPTNIVIAAAEIGKARLISFTNIRYGLEFLEDRNEKVCHISYVIIDREAREIMYLVASVCQSVRACVRPSVCLSPLSQLNCLTYDLDIWYVG